MSNIIRAIFNNVNDKEVFAKARYQYDYGMILRFEGAVTLPSAFEVHFALEKHGEAITQVGDPEGVPVPDALFLAGKTIYAWAYLHSGEDDGYTEYMVQIPVIQRAQPSDEVPTPVQQSAIDQAIAALGVAVEQTAADVETTTENAESAATSAEAAAASAAEAADTAENVEENVTAARAAKAAAEAARDRAVQAETSAGQSKTAAATSEANAAASATAAAASAAAALTSEENANGAMLSAYSDANRADTAADTATSAKNDAVSAKTAAQSAKTAAETAASTATTKASEAAASATTASTAASTATTKAGEAATSATNAAASAQSVASSAAQITQNAEDIDALKEDLTTHEEYAEQYIGSYQSTSYATTSGNYLLVNNVPYSLTAGVEYKLRFDVTWETTIADQVALTFNFSDGSTHETGFVVNRDNTYTPTKKVNSITIWLGKGVVRADGTATLTISCSGIIDTAVEGINEDIETIDSKVDTNTEIFTRSIASLQNSIFDASESTGVIVYIPDIVAGTTLVNIESASLGSDEVIYATGRNMYTDGDVSGTQSKDVTFSNPLPAGTYTISLIANSTDTDYERCALQLTDIDNEAVTTLQFARGVRKSFTFTSAKTIVKATFFASQTWSKGAGDTFSFTDIQIEFGSNVSDYQPAVVLQTATKQTSTTVIALSDNMTVYNLANAQMTVHYKKSADGTKANNNLYGKSVYWDGDSIMYGYGYTGGFANLISQRNAMESTNFAVSGATLAQTSASHCIASSIAQMSNDADYYIFDGGVNDVAETASRGTISDGYDSTLDTTTMIGAFESICKSLVNKPGKKYGYVFVQRIFDASDEWETTLKPMMEQVLNKWGIPYIDLEKEIPPLGFIPSLANAYMADGGKWHPNEDGYKKYFVEKIEAWMQTL